MELSKKAQITGNTTELDEAIRSKVMILILYVFLSMSSCVEV